MTVTYFNVGRMIEKKESKAHHFRIKPLQDPIPAFSALLSNLQTITFYKYLNFSKSFS